MDCVHLVQAGMPHKEYNHSVRAYIYRGTLGGRQWDTDSMSTNVQSQLFAQCIFM